MVIMVITREGTWSQLALSIEGRSSVKTFLNCVWAGTQIIDGRLLNIENPHYRDLIIIIVIITIMNSVWAGRQYMCHQVHHH